MLNINLQPEHLQDNLVKLLPLQVNDFDELYAVASDPEVWTQHPSSDRYKLEVFKSFFESAILSNSAFKIIDLSTNKIIGSTRFYDLDAEQKSTAIGYTFLAKACWGGVYNSAVKKLMINYAFQFVDNIFFHVGATNIISQKAVAKLGAIKLSESYKNFSGKDLLYFEYSLTKNDWKQTE